MGIKVKSMTGFGEAKCVSSVGQFILEIKSVNRRFLEVQIDLPRPFNQFENDVRNWISEKIGRGQVTVSLTWDGVGLKKKMIPNIHLAKEMKKGLDLIAKELKVPYDFSFSLINNEDLFVFENATQNKNLYFSLLKKGIGEALRKHQKMCLKEGMRMGLDIKKRIAFLQKAIKEIDQRKEDGVNEYREKLKKKMAPFFEDQLDEKILKEVFLFAEKSDITEEIVRFDSHLKELSATLATRLVAKGKKMEFLLQELGREINTLSNKVMNATISKLCVDIKGELEKIREQVQNIE